MPNAAKDTPKNTAEATSKIAILDGALHIFRRPDTRYWWCGFHHKGLYVRSSTKCAELEAAKEAARQWYFRKQGEISVGVPYAPKQTTFQHYAEKAVADYEMLVREGKRAASYLKNLRMLYDGDLGKFFNKYPLTAINQNLWNKYLQERLLARELKSSTIHHHLNGIRVVFRRAQLRGELDSTPTFLTERKTAAESTPRTWFEPEQYVTLYKATRTNITLLKGTRWHEAAKDLHDYVLFMVNTGLRVGEAKNLRFCDVSYDKERDSHGRLGNILVLKYIYGKRGRGQCKSYFGAVRPFERIVERRGLKDTWQTSTDRVFPHHHRDMFNTVLNRIGLKYTLDKPPLRRDLMSLRHTYICFRLMDGVKSRDIAATCRTSELMIENHYARWLSPLLANVNAGPLRKFGSEDTDTA